MAAGNRTGPEQARFYSLPMCESQSEFSGASAACPRPSRGGPLAALARAWKPDEVRNHKRHPATRKLSTKRSNRKSGKFPRAGVFLEARLFGPALPFPAGPPASFPRSLACLARNAVEFPEPFLPFASVKFLVH